MSTYKGNGQYVLGKLSLFTKKGDTEEELEWNILPSFVEASLFESLDDVTMSGYVAVIDTFNMTDILPLYGNERVEVEFHTAGNEQSPITYTGYVYKISQKFRVTEHTMGYAVHFSSEAALLSERSLIQRGFKSTVSDAVRIIYDRYLKGSTRKPLNAQQTRGVQTYTLGAVKPLEGISILSRDGRGTDATSGFIFYENNQEYVFRSLQSLYQQEPIARYRTRLAGQYDDVSQRVQEQFESVQDITYNEENSFLDRIVDGLHGSNHHYFDIVTKEIVNNRYVKNEQFDRNKSLGQNPDKKDLGAGDDVTFLNYSSDNLMLSMDEVNNMMKKIESETFKAEITVFGDSTLKVGDVLEVYFPRLNENQDSISTVYEGKVLIDSIRHTITATKYIQEIGVRKDSYNEAVI